MANQITDETIEYVGILAKLELSDAEKEEAKKDMEKIKYNFHKFGDIFDRTNYFENYKFEWFE